MFDPRQIVRNHSYILKLNVTARRVSLVSGRINSVFSSLRIPTPNPVDEFVSSLGQFGKVFEDILQIFYYRRINFSSFGYLYYLGRELCGLDVSSNYGTYGN